MTTSATSALFELLDGDHLSSGTLAYVSTRNRHQAFNLLARMFKESGLTQAELARRIGMPAEVVSRVLKRPRNLELDTFSKLVFGMSGAALMFSSVVPGQTQQQPVGPHPGYSGQLGRVAIGKTDQQSSDNDQLFPGSQYRSC